MTMINVYDSKNKERLLGTVEPISGFRATAQKYEVATIAPVPMYHNSGSKDYIAGYESKVSFNIDWQHKYAVETPTHRVRKERLVFTTDAPLETLLLVTNFRLPGESKGAAERRRSLRYSA